MLVSELLAGSTQKVQAGHRVRSAEDTFRRVESKFSEYGITRLANITGLDRIGIPVYLAVRPNSRSLSVSQGKGIDAASAKVSAAMESIETWHAERPECAIRFERWADLHRQALTLDPTELPLARDSWYTPHRILPWTQGVDLVSGQAVWTPFELVHADATVPRMPGSGCFSFSTNGLASGNVLAEAALHGVCEVIERDAIALWKQRSQQEQRRTRLNLATIDEPACVSLLESFRCAGLVVMAWDVTSDIDVPACMVQLFDLAADEVIAPFATAFGAGCHPQRTVALSRALTEAAQSRLTAISGSRDDGTRRIYLAAHSREAYQHYKDLSIGDGEAVFRGDEQPRRDTIEADLGFVIERLKCAGIDRLMLVDLSREDSPIAVARCIVPGLEGPSSSPSYVAGRRAATCRVDSVQ